MRKVIDTHTLSEVENTAPYVSTPSKKLHHAVNRALDHYLKPSTAPAPLNHSTGSIFVVAPHINNETLLAYACESLASASALANELANEFSGTLDVVHRNTMMALQQVIMLGELAVSRALDNMGTPPSTPAG